MESTQYQSMLGKSLEKSPFKLDNVVINSSESYLPYWRVNVTLNDKYSFALMQKQTVYLYSLNLSVSCWRKFFVKLMTPIGFRVLVLCTVCCGGVILCVCEFVSLWICLCSRLKENNIATQLMSCHECIPHLAVLLYWLDSNINHRLWGKVCFLWCCYCLVLLVVQHVSLLLSDVA